MYGPARRTVKTTTSTIKPNRMTIKGRKNNGICKEYGFYQTVQSNGAEVAILWAWHIYERGRGRWRARSMDRNLICNGNEKWKQFCIESITPFLCISLIIHLWLNPICFNIKLSHKHISRYLVQNSPIQQLSYL